MNDNAHLMSEPLDEALAAGRLSKQAYLLERLRQAEADAERIMAATPEAQAARLQLQYDDRRAYRPRAPHRYHD